MTQYVSGRRTDAHRNVPLRAVDILENPRQALGVRCAAMHAITRAAILVPAVVTKESKPITFPGDRRRPTMAPEVLFWEVCVPILFRVNYQAKRRCAVIPSCGIVVKTTRTRLAHMRSGR